MRRMPPSIATVPMRPLLLFVLAASVAALAAAFAGQYLFGLEPCILCLWQRVPYAVAAILAIAGLAGRTGGSGRLVLALCAGLFAAGAAIAFYHVGVQQHWWGSFAGCGGEPATSLNIDDLRPDALARPPKRCDEVDFRLLGLSLAGWNTLASAALAVVCFAGVVRIRRRALA